MFVHDNPYIQTNAEILTHTLHPSHIVDKSISMSFIVIPIALSKWSIFSEDKFSRARRLIEQ